MVMAESRTPSRAQHGLQPVAAVRRVRQSQIEDARDGLGCGGLRMRFVDRRQILETLDAMCLKAPPPLEEACAVHAAAPARFRRVAPQRAAARSAVVAPPSLLHP